MTSHDPAGASALLMPRRYDILGSRRTAVLFSVTVFVTTLIQVLSNPVSLLMEGYMSWELPLPEWAVMTVIVAGCAVQSVALVWAERMPHQAVLITVATYLLIAVGLQIPSWLSAMYLVISAALFLLATRLSALATVLWTSGVIAAVVIALFLALLSWGRSVGEAQAYVLRESAGFTMPAIAVAALGLWWGTQARRVERASEEAALAKQEHDRRIEEAQRAERARIAQELHDVAGQHLAGLITLAEAAATLVDTQPQRAMELVASVKNEGRFAAASVTGALSDLRATGAEPPSKTADLRRAWELAEYWDRIGMSVEVDVVGSLDDLPVVVSSTAYRALQEALTNVAKHAAGAPVRVRIRVDAFLDMVIENDADGGRVKPASDVGLGWGLASMHERTLLLRGTLTAGPVAGGGWRVHLRVPLNEEALVRDRR